tara:strand:- start:426 stop:638 length:213 start_codon:yes stop_codon:yes gene_type:complete
MSFVGNILATSDINKKSCQLNDNSVYKVKSEVVNDCIFIYKDVFDFEYVFDFLIKYNGDKISVNKGDILI